MLGFGYRILDLLGERSSEILPIAWLPALIRNLISPAMLLLIFWCSYVFLPSRRPKFRNTFWGALLTALFWRGVAALYTVFLQRSMERYSYIYGGLAGLVLLLLWIYACMYCWLLGAELNRLLQERSASLKLPTRRFIICSFFVYTIPLLFPSTFDRIKMRYCKYSEKWKGGVFSWNGKHPLSKPSTLT